MECYNTNMALFLKQDDDRSDLQKRIAAELQAKMAGKPKQQDLPDGVEDSQYIKGTKQTTTLAWVWILIIVAAVGITIWLTVLSMSHR